MKKEIGGVLIMEGNGKEQGKERKREMGKEEIMAIEI
jgi:hypothetical protein